MRKTAYIAIVTLFPLLGGCGLYKKYDRQAFEYNADRIVMTDSSDTPLNNLPWRELFCDSHLAALIDSGLSRNTDLRIAQLKVDEAAATLKASNLAFLPSLKLGADGSLTNNSGNRFQIAPTASWELDIFGRQRNLQRGAEAGFYASQAYRQAVQTSLIATIAESYYTLLMLDEQLGISERTLKTWDENIRVMQALKRAGRTNEAAVLQAKANRMKVETSALTLKNHIFAQENALRSLLLDPEVDLSRGRLSDQQFPDTVTSGVSVDLLSNRPDVREAEFALQRSFYNINVARAAFYPSLTLSGTAGWTTSSGTSIANPSSRIANAIGSIVAPIFNRGTNKANLDIAKDEYEIASLNFQQKLLNAGLEVNDALSSWQTAKGRLQLDKKQIVALKGAVHNTRLLMRNTDTNYLEVLTAQQRLLEAELTEAADRYAEIQSVISLYRALGGGAD